jgi:hypothetical protein
MNGFQIIIIIIIIIAIFYSLLEDFIAYIHILYM